MLHFGTLLTRPLRTTTRPELPASEKRQEAARTVKSILTSRHLPSLTPAPPPPPPPTNTINPMPRPTPAPVPASSFTSQQAHQPQQEKPLANPQSPGEREKRGYSRKPGGKGFRDARVEGIGAEEARGAYRERVEMYEENMRVARDSQTKLALFPVDRPREARGLVPEDRGFTTRELVDGVTAGRVALLTNKAASLASRARDVAFQQPGGQRPFPGRETPPHAVHRVNTPQTREVPLVFRRPPVDHAAALAHRHEQLEHGLHNKQFQERSRMWEIFRDEVAAETPRARAPFPAEAMARDRRVRYAEYAENKVFQEVSELPDVFAHWQEVSRHDPLDSARTVTPLNQRVHAQTPTSRSVPRALRAAPLTRRDYAGAHNQAREARLRNQETGHASTVAAVFKEDPAPAPASPNPANPSNANPNQEQARTFRQWQAGQARFNRERSQKRDLNIFEWKEE